MAQAYDYQTGDPLVAGINRCIACGGYVVLDPARGEAVCIEPTCRKYVPLPWVCDSEDRGPCSGPPFVYGARLACGGHHAGPKPIAWRG